MRRFWVAIAVAGCTYPEFQFAADSATVDAAGDTAVADTAVADTTIANETAPPDTFTETDSGTIDSSMEDSDVTDTFVPDTFVADTFKPDTFVADTFKPDAPLSTGCTGVAVKFCSDWDKATTPSSDFSYFGVSPTGSTTLDTTGGRSLPNAFYARTTPSSTDKVVVANVSKKFTAATADALIRVDAYIKLDSATFTPGTGGGGAFIFKVQRDGGAGDGVTFSIDDGGFYVDRIGVTYDYYSLPSPMPKAGVWTHIRMHTKLHSTAGSVTLWIDDMTTPVLSKSAISTVAMDSTDKILIVGLYSQNATTPVGVRYDDVTLDY
jgi:hypothetical protein